MTADNICIVGLIISGLLFLLLLVGVVKCVISINKHKRVRKDISLRVILEIVAFTLVIITLLAILYIAPTIFYNGVTWGFVFVWLPVTVKYFVLVVTLTILMSYVLLLLLSLNKKVKIINNNL